MNLACLESLLPGHVGRGPLQEAWYTVLGWGHCRPPLLPLSSCLTWHRRA